MTERELKRAQNWFSFFVFLVIAGFFVAMYLAHKDSEERVLSVKPTCYYKVFRDGTVLAGLHLPVNLGGYPDHYGPRLKETFVNDNVEVFGIPLNDMWGTYFEEYHARVKYREFESYSQMMEELRKVNFMILIYQSNN